MTADAEISPGYGDCRKIRRVVVDVIVRELIARLIGSGQL